MSSPRFDALPDACLVDAEVRIRLEGLQPGARVRLRLANAGAPGTMWASDAEFLVEDGSLDLARDAPLAGAYAGVDAMGLFWSRTAQPAIADGVAADPMVLTLTARFADGRPPLSHRVRRYFRHPAVRLQELREDGLVGKLFTPETAGPHPAVLVLGGSGGGFQWCSESAALLASHGFAALALGYFGLEGLPATLDRIPLEYFDRALAWMTGQERVDAKRIGVLGVSRGGELALLLAASFPRIRAVAAFVPSGILWPAFPTSGHAAWTSHGQELPCAGLMAPVEWTRMLAEAGVADESPASYFLCLKDPAVVEAATIPVERIQGPVMVVTGGSDGLWPSEALAAFALRRLEQHRFPYRVEHLSYPDAGHAIGWPNVTSTMIRFKHPVSGDEIDMGGTAAANAHASRDAWPRMVAFLHSSLAQPPACTGSA
jgi:dienelactone hydrolase